MDAFPSVRSVVVPLVLLMLAACATTQPSERAASSQIISAEAIEAQRHNNLYDVVQALRPRWLRARGMDSLREPSITQVYLDNMRMGGPDALRSISPQGVREIRYHSASEATQRWGTGHGAGAIQVISRP